MKLEQIIAIGIPCIMIIGCAIFHIIEFFEKNNPIYNNSFPRDDKEVIQYIKDDLIKQENEELRRAIKQTSCTSKQYEVALDQMRDCANKLTVSELVVNPPVSDDVLTFEAILTPNEMRKMLGLDELEEYEATIKDFKIKKVSPYGGHTTIIDEEEPKSKKLQPLLCKMCGGTVAKKGDNYECEYCGLRYEWR